MRATNFILGFFTFMGATMSHLRLFALITISCAVLWGCSAKQNQELTAAQEQAVAGSGGCTVKQQAVKAAVGSKGSEYVVGLTGSGLPTRLSIRP